MATIGFLHTADVHVATFGRLVSEVSGDFHDVHLVDVDLLDEARASGITAGVRERMADHLAELARDADVIVCTCSTLGAVAEGGAAAAGVPVMRVDRPMAERAVRAGRRVAVVAAVTSTLAPTRALLEECAAGLDTEIRLMPCVDAWPLFEAGALDRYSAIVAEHVRRIATNADVVVLAQAGMAPVEPLVADLGIPVFSSPRSGVEEAVRMAGAGPATFGL
jgi:Asp/Glu/hydantoin racemase